MSTPVPPDDAADARPDAEPDATAEAPFDAAAGLALIRDQQERVRAAREPDSRLLFGAWGIAWIAGYLSLWASVGREGADPSQPAPWAYVVFGCAILAAMAFTIVHTVRRTSGVRGVTARWSALYGWSWTIGFFTMSGVLAGLAGAGAPSRVIALAANALACIVVGLLYLGGAIAFQDPSLYAVGVWMLMVAAAATIVGLPGTYLVMALAGGGGFLLMAGVSQVLRARRRRSASSYTSGVTGRAHA
jgi:hypothetical protein